MRPRIAARLLSDPLERLLRYCARPPLADDRLRLRPDGRVLLELETPWHDATTHLDLDPLDFLARCAALIPRPHKNLIVYHGVLAAHARRSGTPSCARPGADRAGNLAENVLRPVHWNHAWLSRVFIRTTLSTLPFDS